ncbi:expressed protein [Phakopsora pachyrhizi]|uniref:Expressed protein n=1 Tax=Phakopsora pachyrhizi TaxID=170000 RepID=A0AAV0AUY3_PHAPC|nr:expressed protein [Phakopsora pachyrhizi]
MPTLRAVLTWSLVLMDFSETVGTILPVVRHQSKIPKLHWRAIGVSQRRWANIWWIFYICKNPIRLHGLSQRERGRLRGH